MITRIITAIVALAVCTPFLIFSDTVAFPLLAAFFTVVGVYEMLRCVGYFKNYSVSVPALILAAAVPMAAWFIRDIRLFVCVIAVVLDIFLMYLLCISVLHKGSLNMADVSIAFVTSGYIIIGFASLVALRYVPGGQYIFWLAFISAWITDIFAYFTGRLFGRHKLIEKVSPKKTVEGAIGGIVFCAAAFVAYGLAIEKTTAAETKVLPLIIVGVILSVISQFGDLILSLIKRQYGIKDYGKLFPGHGGVLDRFDSVIAVAPVLLIACSISELFTVAV